eukprot:COSAG01_NODE_11184_length_1988_cov_2.370566_3_plen_267_part_00
MAEEDPSLTTENPLHMVQTTSSTGHDAGNQQGERRGDQADDPSHQAAAAAELAAMKPSALRREAAAMNIAEGLIDEAEDSDNPKDALIELLLTNNFRGGPSSPPAALLLRATAPQDCEVMISFNTSTAGEEAIALTKYLEAHDIKTFCTALWCPQGGAGANWRQDTIKGVKTCKVYVPLMTDGWQDSTECQFETQRALNRLAAQQVVFVPVQYESFSVEADENGPMFMDMIGTSTQIIFKDTDVDWMGAVLRGARSCFQERCAFAS